MDLKAAVRTRILDGMVRKVAAPRGAPKVLVVDRLSVRILAESLPLTTLSDSENGISLIEFLDLSREPLPALHAIYFLSSTPESIAAFADEDPKQYAAFHLFTLTRLDDLLMKKIRTNKDLMKKIKTLSELELDYFVPQGSLFHFGRGPSVIPRLYFPASPKRAEELHSNSHKLANICSLAVPEAAWNIRYFGASDACKALAAFTKSALAEGPPPTSLETATLLIVDRAADVVSPLLHEFTYQSMALDVVEMDRSEPGCPEYKWAEDGKDYSCKFGEEDDDKTWRDVRHLHIAEASEKVNGAFKAFTDSNAAAKLSSRPNSPLSPQSPASPTGDASLGPTLNVSELSAAVRALPEYTANLKRFAMHVHLLEDCFKKFKSSGLDAVAMAEQNLALGFDARDGRIKSEAMLRHLREVMGQPQVSAGDKARLLLLAHAVAKGSASFTSRPSALSVATFANNFNAMDLAGGPQFTSQIKGIDTVLSTPGAAVFTGSDSWRDRRRNRKASRQAQMEHKARLHGDQLPYELSRYSSPFRDVLEELTQGSLSIERFPFASAARTDDAGAPVVRPCSPERPHRFIVFVAGGLTYSEIREAYDVSARDNGASFIVGSAGLLSPLDFIRGLEALSSPALAAPMFENEPTLDPVNMARRAAQKKKLASAASVAATASPSVDFNASSPQTKSRLRIGRKKTDQDGSSGTTGRVKRRGFLKS